MIFFHQDTVKSVSLTKSKENFTAHNEFSFAIEVKKYCKYRPKINFCSKKMTAMMLEIERERSEKLELARHFKRMENEIISKVFNMCSNKP